MSLLNFGILAQSAAPTESLRPVPRPERVTVPKKIRVTEVTTFRDTSFFGGQSNLLGVLNAGDEAEVLSVNTNHSSGVGFQVRISSGPRKGQIGWVYYAKDPKVQKIELLDEDDNKFQIPKPLSLIPGEDEERWAMSNGMEGVPLDVRMRIIMDKEFNKYFDELAKEMVDLGDGKMNQRGIPQRISRLMSDKEIWEKVSTGDMQLDMESYRGGNYFPFTQRYTDENGYSTDTTYWAKASDEFLSNIPETIRETIKNNEVSGCDPSGEEGVPSPEELGEWTTGCHVLGYAALGDQHFNMLTTCLDNLKAKVLQGASSGNSINRDKAFRNMYSKLNSKEQEFLAMTITSFGEAGILAPPLEEMVMVMKVLQNRKEYAQKKGFRDANELDAALQSWQFSMYNKNDPNWKRAIRANNSNPHTVNSIKSYILFQNTKFTGSSKIDEIYHYHTNYVKPDWRQSSKIVKPVLNGRSLKQSGTRHIFYRNIPWSFRHNNWSGK